MKGLKFLAQHKQFTLFLILALAAVAVAVFAPWIAPKDPMMPSWRIHFRRREMIIYAERISWDGTCCPGLFTEPVLR